MHQPPSILGLLTLSSSMIFFFTSYKMIYGFSWAIRTLGIKEETPHNFPSIFPGSAKLLWRGNSSEGAALGFDLRTSHFYQVKSLLSPYFSFSSCCFKSNSFLFFFFFAPYHAVSWQIQPSLSSLCFKVNF